MNDIGIDIHKIAEDKRIFYRNILSMGPNMVKRISLILLVFTVLDIQGYSQSPDDQGLILSIEFGNLSQFREEVRDLQDIDFTLSNGYTLLTFAIIRNRPDFVRYLLRRNVDIEKPVNSISPLMYSTDHVDILRMLISAGADLDRLVDGRTAMSVAITVGNWEAANILRESGAVVEPIEGPDGPYIINLNADTTLIVSVTASNQLILDTINNHIHDVYIRTPINDSFMFVLRDPVFDYESVFEAPEEIFVMSDIEGNYLDFVDILKNNSIVDNNLNWSFGKGHLVLLGDFVDRGRFVTQVLWLIYKLELEAAESGGKVHFILGNHEVMNVIGDARYVHDKYHILSYLIGMDIRDFYSNNSFLGRWIRSKNVMEKIGNYIFVHGGISDSLVHAGLSIARINNIVRDFMARPDSVTDLYAPLVLNEYGVLWYRGLITDYIYYEKATPDELDEILSFYDATNIVIGHSIVDEISCDYDGKVIRIDVDHYRSLGVGILIDGDNIYKATRTGERQLVAIPEE